jgi:hypothetical protein
MPGVSSLRLLRVLALAFLAAAALPATASVIYDNGAPSSIGGFTSDYDDNNPFNLAVLTADNFVLGAAGIRVTDVHWWGFFEDTPSDIDDFTIIFYEATGAGPGSVLAEYHAGSATRVSGSGTFLDPIEYRYILPTALELEAGTTYFISIANDTPNEDRWLWSDSEAVGDGVWQLVLPDGDWQVASGSIDVAFQLTGGIVPEPTTLSLLGLGLSGLVLRRVKHRRR